LAGEIDGADNVFGVGRVGRDFMLQVEAGGDCYGQPGKKPKFEIASGEQQVADE